MESTSPDTTESRLVEDEPVLPRQRRPRYKRDEALPTTTSEQLGSIIAHLGTLQSQLQAEEQRATQAAAPSGPGRKVLQERRLSRSGILLDSALGPILPAVDTPPGVFSAEVEPGILPESGWMGTVPGYVALPLSPAPVWYESPAAALASSPSSWSTPEVSPPRRRWWQFVAGILLLLGMGVAAGFAWHAYQFRPEPETRGREKSAAASVRAGIDDLADGKLPGEAQAAVDQVLDAMNRGDLPAATALLDDARRRRLTVPGLSYQAALLALGQGDEDLLFHWTSHAIAAHESVPECWYLRACYEDAQGKFQEAADSLGTAAILSPFDPRYLFFQAEYLRRTGKPAQALPIYQQAVRRRPSTPDTELILFKQRLARLEIGSDEAFQAELSQRLSHEPVSGDTFLLGAAAEINHGDFPAAAEYIRRATRVMSPTFLRGRLRDYFFQAHAREPALTDLFVAVMTVPVANPLPAGGKPLVDPATRGLAEATPAGW